MLIHLPLRLIEDACVNLLDVIPAQLIPWEWKLEVRSILSCHLVRNLQCSSLFRLTLCHNYWPILREQLLYIILQFSLFKLQLMDLNQMLQALHARQSVFINNYFFLYLLYFFMEHFVYFCEKGLLKVEITLAVLLMQIDNLCMIVSKVGLVLRMEFCQDQSCLIFGIHFWVNIQG